MAKKADLLDQSERLSALDEFRALSEQQKRICMEHVSCPELSKYELSQKLGIPKPSVYQFFHSRSWEVLNVELARQQLRELVQLAVKTLREAMLNGRPDVKLMAATRVLVNSDLLKLSNAQHIGKQDNKMIVFWNEDDPIGVKSAVGSFAGGGPLVPPGNGHTDSLPPAPEAEGSPRLTGPL